MDATEQDRERAAELLRNAPLLGGMGERAGLRELVAKALADERERALRPVLELHASDRTDPEACNYCGDVYPCPTAKAATE